MDEKLLASFEYAIETENMEMFDFLMKGFGSFKKKDKNELLAKTILCAKIPVFIERLLDAGADINYKDDDENTLLHYAAASCHPEIVKFLIGKGLDLEAKRKLGATPLCVAAKESESVAVLKTLIEAGADINARSHYGETLLITAAGFNTNTRVIKFLLQKGLKLEDRDDEGFTPLLNAACWQSNIDVMDLLVEAGADIHATTSAGDTLFHIATRNPNFFVADYIRNLFLTTEQNKSGETCLEAALTKAHNGDVLKIYLEKMREEHIMLAAMNPNPDVLETMIQSGYDRNTNDCDGMSVMMMAAKYNTNPDVIRMLMLHNVIWNNKDKNGRTVLHYAAVNAEHLPGDVGRLVACQKRHGGGHVLRPAQPPQQDLLLQLRTGLVRKRPGHVRVDKPGGHGVNAHPPPGQLLGSGLGHADNPRLAGRVVDLARVSHHAHDAGDVDDRARTLFEHLPPRMLEAIERAFEVDAHHGLKVLRSHLDEQPIAGDAGVVN